MGGQPVKLKTIVDAHQVIEGLLEDQAELMHHLCLHNNELYNKRYEKYRALRDKAITVETTLKFDLMPLLNIEVDHE
jgi:tRNA splicing endonuclease